MKKIQLFVPTYHINECLAEIRECLELGWTGLGFKTVKFEEAWKQYTGLPNAHFLNSNTAGLVLAVKIMKHEFGWQDGDEIISTPLTFISSNHAIWGENLRPIFADVDETLCLDPKSVEQKITDKTRAVMYVGMGGNAGQLDEISRLCQKHNLKLILDAAHMSGTRYNGRHVGGEADCAVFSFHAVKNLPTADGGMICFKDGELDRKARMWSWMGINKDTYSRNAKGDYKWYYDIKYPGIKAHGNSIMAAIALVQIKYLDQDNQRRRDICRLYTDKLAGAKAVKLIKYGDDCLPSRHLFQIRVPAAWRDELIAYLNTKEIYPGVHYRANTEYDMYKYGLGACPNAEAASTELISLPLHLRLKNEDVQYICDIIIEFLNKNCQ